MTPRPCSSRPPETPACPRGPYRFPGADTLPRLDNGKPDYATVLARATARQPAEGDAPTDLRVIYARLLDRPDAMDDDTFVSLGGDSLSYVEMSMRIEQVLGHLPNAWHVTSIGDLRRAQRRRRWRVTRTLETGVALRAAAIVLIVGTHAQLFNVLGSAHVLFAVAGYNFARFQLTGADRRARVRHQLSSVARVVAPAVIWIAALHLVTGAYSGANIVLLNSVVGPSGWDSTWHFWFIEMLVYILLAVAALSSVPWLDRAERQWPFIAAMTALALGALIQVRPSAKDSGRSRCTHSPCCGCALGWAAARATKVGSGPC